MTSGVCVAIIVNRAQECAVLNTRDVQRRRSEGVQTGVKDYQRKFVYAHNNGLGVEK